MNDTISRQAAIDALNGEINITGRANAEAVRGYVRLVKDRLERLPSAQPEQLWIPCSERLQEEKEAAFKRGMSCDWIPCEERLPDTPAPVLITIEWADDDLEVTIGEYWSGNDGWGKVIDGKVIAWKPLPEPAGRKQKSYADWE